MLELAKCYNYLVDITVAYTHRIVSGIELYALPIPQKNKIAIVSNREYAQE